MKIARDCSKEDKEFSGIYKLECDCYNYTYIGSTYSKFRLRWNQHSHELINNKHGNSHLQRAFNKHKCNWKFSIVEIISNRDDILNRERYWISEYESMGVKLFNQRKVEDNLFTHDEETKKKISDRLKNKKKGIKPSNYEELRRNWLRPILEYEDGIFIREYESIKEAGEILKVDRRYIWNILKGRVRRIRNFPNKVWKYKYEK